MTGQARSSVRNLTPPRRGLRRTEAALYVGVSTSKFDQMVSDGRMPDHIRIDGCVIWDIRALDAAFDALSDQEEHNPWDADGDEG